MTFFRISTALLLSAGALLACSSREVDKATANTSGAPPDGRAIFKQYCIVCHGADGKLGLNGAKDLTQTTFSLDERIALITNGKNMMTPFGELLSAEEIRAVANYTLKLKSR
jgi:cytochrome c6